MNTVDLLRTLEDEFYEPALCGGTLEFPGGSEPVEVLSLSAHSADLRCSDEIAEEGPVTLAVAGFGRFEGELVRRHGRIIGIIFGTMKVAGTKVARAVPAGTGETRAPATVAFDVANADDVPGPAAGRERTLRRHSRSAVFWSGAVQAGRQSIDCVVLNMSPGGAKIRLMKRYVGDGSPVILHIDRLGGYTSEVVWSEGNTMGLRFLKNPQQVAAEIEQGLRKAPRSA